MNEESDAVIEQYDVMTLVPNKTIYCLDKGMVKLVDSMPRLVPVGQTADQAIVQAARVSYGDGTKKLSEDRGLIRYLMRHQHTTPTEMVEFKFHCKMPIFIARQWIRHRTACLSGDTLLHFDLPGGVERRGNQLYTMTVAEVYHKFQPTENVNRPDKQCNPHHKRDKVQRMMLRCLNEETGLPSHTQVVDIWESGKKDVWEVEYNGKTIKASADHLFFSRSGWRRLGEVADLNDRSESAMRGDETLSWIGPGFGNGVQPHFNVIDPETEVWSAVPAWEAYYEVSSQGRVRRLAGGRGAVRGRCKMPTVSKGSAVVSLNSPGVQETRSVHQLVMLSFVGVCPEGQEVCHEDGNFLNNALDNLRYDTKQSNADDRARDAATTVLAATWVTPRIKYAGQEMTYDLEVAGPWHNFSAGGFVVHNSVNEISGRYSILQDEFYFPQADKVSLQSTANRQGGGLVADNVTATEFIAYLESHCADAYAKYKDYADVKEVSREQARMNLPLNIYTEWYWKIDLHNLFHFLSLRCDAHAQYEIRVFADAMLQLITPIVPFAVEAWNDYHFRREALLLTRLEVEAIKEVLAGVTAKPIATDNKREQAEWKTKLARLGLTPFAE